MIVVTIKYFYTLNKIKSNYNNNTRGVDSSSIIFFLFLYNTCIMSTGETLPSADEFIDAVIRNPITPIDLSSVDIGNRDSTEAEAIRRSLRDDSIYRFTMAANSPMIDSSINSFEWRSSENPSGLCDPFDNVV